MGAPFSIMNATRTPSEADLLSVKGTYKKQDKREEAQTVMEAPSGHDSDADRDRNS